MTKSTREKRQGEKEGPDAEVQEEKNNSRGYRSRNADWGEEEEMSLLRLILLLCAFAILFNLLYAV